MNRTIELIEQDELYQPMIKETILMNDYNDEFLRALELENSLPSTSAAQKEANAHRKHMYLLFMNRKPNNSETTHTDLPLEMYINRMVNPTYRFCPSADWLKR